MSEYQYYEFATIDRALTQSEMVKLRAISTRAVITPGGFTNHYEWGDLKATPADWMRRHFDAFVYSANWCSCRLSLRLPKTAFGKAELRPFITPATLSVESSDTHWILDWTLDESEDYDQATRILVEFAEGYALVSSREDFDRAAALPRTPCKTCGAISTPDRRRPVAGVNAAYGQP